MGLTLPNELAVKVMVKLALVSAQWLTWKGLALADCALGFAIPDENVEWV